MSVQPASVRSQIAARVIAVVTTLRESVEPWEFIRSARSPVHLEYAVGVGHTSREADRQAIAPGALVTTTARVVLAYQIGPKDRVTNFDTARGVSASIRNAIVAKGWTTNLSIRWDEHTETAGIDGWIWLEETFSVLHVLPLS